MNKVLLALALFGSASAAVYTADDKAQRYLFESFKADFGKTYAAGEEPARFAIFLDNLKLIDERNAVEAAAGGSAVHGINKFTDLSAEEFKKGYLNYRPSANRSAVDETIEPLPEGVQALVDWTGVYTTPVKNQGYCGSCWAFSATEQIESDYWRVYGKEYILSPQQVTSCTPYFVAGGCDGGNTENAYDYAEGGIEQDSDYPYTSGSFGVTGSCKATSSKFVVKTTGYTTVSSSASGESKMASYVSATGPLSICVDAESWSSYTSGIMTVCGQSVDHCVQAVGINTAGGYWKVRNSWGTTWGEQGYIQLAYGKNTCNLASDATYSSTASA